MDDPVQTSPQQPKFLRATADLYRYVVAHNSRPELALRELAEETHALGAVAAMQIAVEQGNLLTLLVRLCNARCAVELGTFTGYSTICIARGLVPDGQLLSCDHNPEWLGMATQYTARAGLAERVTFRTERALTFLHSLSSRAEIDFAFVDANKSEYPAYCEELVPRIRRGGLLVLDNTLLDARVLDPADASESARAMRALNNELANDPALQTVLLPIADGVTILHKL